MTLFNHIRNPLSSRAALARRVQRAWPSSLQTTEKLAMRELLSEYAAMRPVRNLPDTRLTLQAETHGAVVTVIRYQIKPMPFIIGALLFSLTGGTAFAAEGALPGDTLYPVKVNINEEVRAALAVSAESKAQWDITRAERRLNEAAELATRKEFTAQHRVEIEENLNEHVRDAAKRSSELKLNERVTAATEVSTRLNALLRAHSELLAQIRDNTNDSATRTELAAAIALLAKHEGDVAEVEHESDSSFIADFEHRSATSTTSALAGVRTAASAKITATERALTKAASTTATTTKAYVTARAKLADAKSAFAAGDTAAHASSTTEAFVHYRTALKLAIEARAYLSASTHEDAYYQEHSREQEHEREMEQEHGTADDSDDPEDDHEDSDSDEDSDKDDTGLETDTEVRINISGKDDREKIEIRSESENKIRLGL